MARLRGVNVVHATGGKTMQRFDAIIAGGGISGSTTAAALASKGLNVVVCEAGLPSERRLAGELMHPPAAQALDDVGLLEPLIAAGAAPVYGFAVFRGAGSEPTLLSYAEVPGGRPSSVAMDHAALNRVLLDTVTMRPNITVLEGARVTEVKLNEGDTHATIWRNGQELELCAPLFVSAEGRGSKIRQRAGIGVQRTDPFRMIGWKIPGGRLPVPGHGHVFCGEGSAILASQVSPDEVRIMFELEIDDPLDVREQLALLPRPFRDDVERAIASQPQQSTKVFGLTPDRVTSGRLAVVGDAGGCVHPLTASGIAFCTRDASRLADEIALGFDSGHGVPAALQRYEDGRRGPMFTRAALGPAMVDALVSQTPEMRLLRHGLFRYWDRSPRGRGVSLGLLSTHESRPTVMAREYASVCAHALTGLPHGVITLPEVLPAVMGLARRSSRFLRDAIANV
jgi:2-polyprenyl-6-methoxyphenol hydroxylase-like FAD-dependent oxidoreductase